jgi:hypothetical protein
MNISMTATMPVLGAAEAYRRVGAAISAIEDLLDTCPDGIFEGTIRDLAAVAGCDGDTAREAISALDPADHVLSVDVTDVSEIESFTLEWAPVTAIVNLLLDWDLLTLEITTEELAQWLAVSEVGHPSTRSTRVAPGRQGSPTLRRRDGGDRY